MSLMYIKSIFSLSFGSVLYLPYDLSRAGQAGFHLQAQTECRHFFFILGSDFGALWARAYYAHVAFQYVEYLRQFVETDGSYDFAYRRDTIVVSCCQARYAILFSIYAHTSEFQNFETSAILCQTYLLIERRAMIVCLNHYRCYRHERTCDYQAYGCYDYIQSTLCEGVFRLEHGTLGAHNRHAKRLYVLSACYDYVTGVRYKIAVYIFIYARFDYAIAERRVLCRI